MIFNQLIFVFGLTAIGYTQAASISKVPIRTAHRITPQSCLDYLQRGFKSDGYYIIYDFKTKCFITVYCDMNSEAGSAWTLIMSYALKNMRMASFTKNPFPTNSPVNEHSPNWNIYRMSLSQMKHLKSQSTHWRSTCSFPVYGVDYSDYVRGTFAVFDPMTTLGRGMCKRVEYVNIRGHQCSQCTAKWWQTYGICNLHIDSSYSGCQFFPTTGSKPYEDNFGLYNVINKHFRCSAGPNSTTNWWFGGYM